jgi:hypothetical protein
MNHLTPRPAAGKRPRIRGNELVIDAVNTILWLYWDPIGCGVPVDEYRHVAECIVRMRCSEPVHVECRLLAYQRCDLGMGGPFDLQKIERAASRVIEALRPHGRTEFFELAKRVPIVDGPLAERTDLLECGAAQVTEVT